MIFGKGVNYDDWVACSDDRERGQHLGICLKMEDSQQKGNRALQIQRWANGGPGDPRVPELRSPVFQVAGKVSRFNGQWISWGMRQGRDVRNFDWNLYLWGCSMELLGFGLGRKLCNIIRRAARSEFSAKCNVGSKSASATVPQDLPRATSPY
jgi:hypothetical protein